MHKKTQERVIFLQAYLKKRHKKLRLFDPENIVGLSIGKKQSKKETKNYYSIRFHVARKKKPKNIEENKIIPALIPVKFPDGKIKKIKTDVIERGRPSFHLSACKKRNKNGSFELGTVGVFLRDASGNFYGLTNYHVAAWDKMLKEEYYFEGDDTDIFVDGNREDFVEGIFSDELDIAFIQLSDAGNFSNEMGDGTQITGYLDGPLSPNLIGKDVTIYSSRLQNGKQSTISNNATVWYPDFKGLSLEGVIEITPKRTIKGDSGGAVLIDEMLLGIVVGGDNHSTYAIPYFKIDNYKPLQII